MMRPLLFILLTIVATTTTTATATDTTDLIILDNDNTTSRRDVDGDGIFELDDDRMILTKKQIKKWKKQNVLRDKRKGKWEIGNDDELNSSFFKRHCCAPRRPSCCSYGKEMLWSLGKKDKYTVPGMMAQQPAVYNPQCFNSIDFDTFPLSSGQPFCNEFTIENASNIKAASLQAIIHSKPPCKDTIQDRFCLTTALGTEWCTMLQPGENKFCLDLDELGLIDGDMSTLLARTAYHSSVDYLRLHVVFCDSVVYSPVTSDASIHFKFENNLVSTTGSPSFDFMLSSPSYFNYGPQGTALQFPESPNIYLETPNHSSQQGGSAMSMALWVYFDEPDPDLVGAGMTLAAKYGSYRWMMIPGYRWSFMHVHLGPGSGNLIFAKPNPDNTGFQIPVKKWLCMAVTIEADVTTDTTTLHYYLNGQLWGPPTVANQAYNMDGSEKLIMNGLNDGVNWAGKVDTFALWQSALHAKDVSRFCKCEPNSV